MTALELRRSAGEPHDEPAGQLDPALAVEVRDLVKRYPKRPSNAVDGVSFAVRAGEIFGLLGPNGAGKTTSIGILTTRVRITSGLARVAGVDVTADPVLARSRLSVVPQRSNLDRALTARQNLVFHAAYHGMGRAERNRRADELLDQFGLEGRGGDKVDNYSGGMAQRLLIARALMHRPQVLFLDEPSTGLDPQARLFVWEQVRELRDAGVTVVITTHDMDEAAELTDRVGIMDHGRLLALDTPSALTRTLPGGSTLELVVTCPPDATPEQLMDALGGLPGVEQVEQIDSGSGSGSGSDSGSGVGADAAVKLRLYLEGEGASHIAPVAELLARRGARLGSVALGEPTLEDVFLTLTGRDLR